MQRLGLEWMHRLLHEPRRLFGRYVLQGLPFSLRLFGWALGHRLVGRPCLRPEMIENATNGRAQIDDDLVIVTAGTSSDGIWQSERHVAMHLAERHPVLWVDPQISRLSPMHNPVAREALHEPRLRWVAPNIIRVTPVTVPGVTRPLLRDLAARQARRAVRQAVVATGAKVHSTVVSRSTTC